MVADPHAFNANRDSLSYPPIPVDSTEFQNKQNGFERPVAIRYWDWSVTFGRWGALCEFANGSVVYTYPKTW